MKLNKNNNFSLIAESVKSFTAEIGEDPADRANELEVEAELEEAHQENLEAEAKEQTEYMAEREDEYFKYGPDNIERN